MNDIERKSISSSRNAQSALSASDATPFYEYFDSVELCLFYLRRRQKRLANGDGD